MTSKPATTGNAAVADAHSGEFPTPPPWEMVLDHPAWSPYATQLRALPRDRFPTAADLSELLGPGQRTTSGRPIRFETPDVIEAREGEGAYEREIAETGRVSTRPGSLHDLCNALAWARFPRLKAQLNALHIEALPDSRPGRRGPVRDALTLFDECGLVVTCPERAPLEALAAHDWARVFGRSGERWGAELDAWLVGHASLEKWFAPYKAMTGHCLLLHTPSGPANATMVDTWAAEAWRRPDGPRRPADLCPLPFTGIPGWSFEPQDAAFYDDPSVFRPPAPSRSPPPVFEVSAPSRR